MYLWPRLLWFFSRNYDSRPRSRFPMYPISLHCDRNLCAPVCCRIKMQYQPIPFAHNISIILRTHVQRVYIIYYFSCFCFTFSRACSLLSCSYSSSTTRLVDIGIDIGSEQYTRESLVCTAGACECSSHCYGEVKTIYGCCVFLEFHSTTAGIPLTLTTHTLRRRQSNPLPPVPLDTTMHIRSLSSWLSLPLLFVRIS